MGAATVEYRKALSGSQGAVLSGGFGCEKLALSVDQLCMLALWRATTRGKSSTLRATRKFISQVLKLPRLSVRGLQGHPSHPGSQVNSNMTPPFSRTQSHPLQDLSVASFYRIQLLLDSRGMYGTWLSVHHEEARLPPSMQYLKQVGADASILGHPTYGLHSSLYLPTVIRWWTERGHLRNVHAMTGYNPKCRKSVNNTKIIQPDNSNFESVCRLCA